MRVSDLLRATVVDTNGRRLGSVRDLHLVQDGPLRSSGQASLRVHGLVAGRTAFATRLGYENREGIEERRETRGPLPIRACVRWLHRNAVYIRWEDIVEITDDRLVVRGH
jgi:sporulation protein YlmC with PRC-barrel domain